MRDTKSNVPLQFGFTIQNDNDRSVNIALFAGGVHTTALVETDTEVPVLTHGDASNLNKMGLGIFDAVLCDGLLPGRDGIVRTIENFVKVTPIVSTFSINHMREYLKSNSFKISRMIIKVDSQDQFDNQIQLATLCPFKHYGISAIAPTNYASPSNYQNNKIIIDDVPYVLGDDTFIGWTINAKEKVSITFELID